MIISQSTTKSLSGPRCTRLRWFTGLKIKFISKENMGLAIYSICKSVLDSLILK